MNIRRWLRYLWVDNRGQDLIEYALLLFMIGLASVAGVRRMGQSVSNSVSNVASVVKASIPGGGGGGGNNGGNGGNNGGNGGNNGGNGGDNGGNGGNNGGNGGNNGGNGGNNGGNGGNNGGNGGNNGGNGGNNGGNGGNNGGNGGNNGGNRRQGWQQRWWVKRPSGSHRAAQILHGRECFLPWTSTLGTTMNQVPRPVREFHCCSKILTCRRTSRVNPPGCGQITTLTRERVDLRSGSTPVAIWL